MRNIIILITPRRAPAAVGDKRGNRSMSMLTIPDQGRYSAELSDETP
jgi:hypothetical protein